MINLIRADLYGLRKSKTIWLLFGFMCLCVAAMAGFSHAMTGGEMSADIVGLASFFTDYQMMPLLGTILAAVFICGDFENKTIHDMIAVGAGRKAVLVSKAVTFLLVILFLLSPYMMAAGVGFLSGYEFSEFLPSVFLYVMALDSAGAGAGTALTFLMAFLAAGVVYAGQLSICILLAFALRKNIAVIGIGYGLSFLCGQLATVEKLRGILSYTPFGMDFIALVEEPGLGIYVKTIGSSLLFIVVVMAITYYLFRKSEIK